MIDLLNSFFPAAIGIEFSLVLLMVSFIGSLLSVALGIGGGTLVLAVMASVMPIPAVVPVHGVVQLGSNLGRSVLLFNAINWRICGWFAIGALIGTSLGAELFSELSARWLGSLLGLFILYSVWVPNWQAKRVNNKTLLLGGLFTSALTLFVGATGPLVITLIRKIQGSKQAIVANSAACMVVQHSLKIAVFGLLGFAFANYIGLIAGMIVTGLVGTIIGKRILISINTQHFQWGLKLILTGLAVKLLLSGW